MVCCQVWPLTYVITPLVWSEKKGRPGSSIKTEIRVPVSTVLSFKFWSVRLCYATFFTYVPRGKCFSRIQWRILRCITGITEHVITFHILAAYQRYHYPSILLFLNFLQCHHVAFPPRIGAPVVICAQIYIQPHHRKNMDTDHRCYETQWSQHAVQFVNVLLVWWHRSLWCTSIYHLSRWLMCGRGHLGGANFRKLLFIVRVGFKARYNS